MFRFRKSKSDEFSIVIRGNLDNKPLFCLTIISNSRVKTFCSHDLDKLTHLATELSDVNVLEVELSRDSTPSFSKKINFL